VPDTFVDDPEFAGFDMSEDIKMEPVKEADDTKEEEENIGKKQQNKRKKPAKKAGQKPVKKAKKKNGCNLL